MNTQNPKTDTASTRANIIQAVQTPLGFFSLVVLVVEVIFGIAAGYSQGADRSLLIICMVIIIFLLIIIVSGLAIFRPEALSGKRPSGTKASEFSKKYFQSLGNIASAWRTDDAAIDSMIQGLVAAADNDPHSEQQCYEIAMIYRDRLRDYGLAIWWFVTAINKKPSTSPPYDRIAEIFENLQDFDQAIQWYVRSADADAGNCWPCDRLGLLLRDRKYDFERSINWFKESIRRKPTGNSIPYDRIAEIYRDRYQDYDQAIQWFTNSAAADPGNEWPCDELGKLYKDKKGDIDNAVKWYKESIRRKPNRSAPYDRIAEIYRDHFHDIPQAIAWFRKSAEVEPDNPYPRDRLRELHVEV